MRPSLATVTLGFLRHEVGRRDGLWLAATTLRLWARSRARRPETPIPVRITAPNGATTALKLWTYIDALVLREVYVDGDYPLPADLRPTRIVDLGANTGVSVRFFRTMFPDASITAVEPDPVNFERLRQNVADARLVRAAVAVERGAGTFYSAEDGWASTLRETRDAEPVEVELLTVDDVVQTGGGARPDLVKIDIEGGEWPLLEAGALQQATDCIVGELHFHDGRSAGDAARMLAGWRLDVRHKHAAVATFTARRRPDADQ